MHEFLTDSTHLVMIAAAMNVGCLVVALWARIYWGVVATANSKRLVNVAFLYLIVGSAMTGVPFDVRPPEWLLLTRIVFIMAYVTIAGASLVGVAQAIIIKQKLRGN